MGESSVYLESIALVRTHPCLADPSRIIVIGKPSRDLDDVLPFLAALPNTITYNPTTKTLTFRRPRGFMTLYCDRVIITHVDHTEQGLALLVALVDAINATWTNRHELIAVTKPQRAPVRWMSGICSHNPTAGSAAKRPAWRLPLGCCSSSMN